MSATIGSARLVKFSGLTASWLIEESYTKEESGMTFVLLDPTNYSLKKLIIEKNTNVPKPVPNNFTIVQKVGYQALLKARNEAHALELHHGSDPNSACSLFSGVVSAQSDEIEPPKQPKRLKKAAKACIALEEVLTVDVELDNTAQKIAITCLRSNAKARVYIKCDEINLTNAIVLLRAASYAKSTYRERDPTLGKGIWRRGDKFLVVKQVSSTSKCSYSTYDDHDKAVVASTEDGAEANADEASDAPEASQAVEATRADAANPESQVTDIISADGALMIM
jgi:hypothetical protein